MDNESLDDEIAQLQRELGPLREKHEKLRRQFQSSQVQMARYSHLIDEKERLEREIASMEGRRRDGDENDHEGD